MENKVTKTINVNDYITAYSSNENIFESLPEFAFLKPICSKVKQNSCTCGLGPDIARATAVFNDLVLELSEDAIQRVKNAFQITGSLCFGLISPKGDYEIKCYS